MTRETKIGLLVGLAFIIVIGILLSDHFRSTTEPPVAPLADAGGNARAAVAPPVGVRPVVLDAPSNPIPTTQPMAAQRIPANDPRNAPVRGTMVAGADNPSGLDPLLQQHPDELTPANPADAVAVAGGTRPYVAQPGDNVSKMAARLLGSSSMANIQAIIRANPSLEANPNKIVVGRTYQIPAPGSKATAAAATPTAPAPTAVASANQPGLKRYTAQSGDTVSRLAARYLGSNTQAHRQAIIDANPSLQDNPDRIVVGRTYLIPVM